MSDKLVPYDSILDGQAESVGYKQPEEDAILHGKLLEELRWAMSDRYGYEVVWERNRRVIKGESLAVHRETGDVVFLEQAKGRRFNAQNNVCRPTERAFVGKVCRNIPTMRVVPASTDFAEQHGARTADGLMQYIRRMCKLDLKYQQGIEHLSSAGNAYYYPYWDTTKGRRIAVCSVCDYVGHDDEVGTDCPSCKVQREEEYTQQLEQKAQIESEQLLEFAINRGQPQDLPQDSHTLPPAEQLGPLGLGEPIPLLESAFEGDFDVRVLDPRDVWPQPGATCVQDSQYIIIRYVLKLSEARRRFPSKAPFLTATMDVNAYSPNDLRRFGDSDAYYFSKHEQRVDTLEVYEWHERPTENYPNGRIIYMTNEFLLGEEESPYYNLIGRHPIFHFRSDVNPGEFMGEPWMLNAWHMQRQVNHLETVTREHAELTVRNKWLVPYGSRVAVDEINAETAQIITYNRSAGKPEQIMPAPIPGDLTHQIDRKSAQIRAMAGVTDAEAGMASSSASGRNLAIAEAESDQQVGPILRRINEEWRELYRAALIFYRAFSMPDRTWTVLGPHGTEMYYLKQLNLSPGWDVQLEAEDGMSRNRAVRLQQAMELLGTGFFTDPQTGMLDKKAFAQAAKLNTPVSGHDAEASERAAAASIPEKIRRGEPYQPMPFDDPEMFAEELLGWLRDARFREDPALIGQVNQFFQYYVMWAETGVMPDTGAISGAQAGQSQAGQSATGQGGSPSSFAGTSPELAVGQQAANTVGQADQAAEATARMTAQQES